MNWIQGLKMAWKSIISNKMRSFLTMLGIIIGVAAVIVLVSLGQGATASVKETVESLGTNLLTVNVTGRGAQTSLTYNEAMKFAELPGVLAVSPVISGSVKAKNGILNEDVSLEGISPEYESVRNTHVQAGRFLLPIDIQFRQKVALIGTTTAQTLFGASNPVGSNVLINGTRFLIVGLLETKGSSLGGNNDDRILIPITSAERLLASKGVRQVYIQAKSANDVETAKNALDTALQKKFRGTETNAGYRIFNQQDALDTVSSITQTLTLTLGGIAAISLFVGGIGIMNIMLVSVSERTREIGIRKAVGAKKRDILIQFLIESMVLGGIGGILGVGAGLGGSILISKLLSMTTVLSFEITIIAFAFSLSVGILFGLLPANKASSLKPIEALRSE